MKAYIDGASKGNPGQASIGVLLLDENGHMIERLSRRIGVNTNNVAEYTALITAMEHALHMKVKTLDVVTDSQLLERQVNGEYKVKNDNLKTLVSKVRELQNKFVSFSINSVPRGRNKLADGLANEVFQKIDWDQVCGQKPEK